MKLIALALLLFTGTQCAQAAANISVVIDGESYSCSPGGGGGGGNLCECMAARTFSFELLHWQMFKQGRNIGSSGNSFNTEAEAIADCRRRAVSETSCYQ